MYVLAFVLTLSSRASYAWGPGGHQRIGAIAAALIKNTRASKEVASLLGDISLASASVWADCTKGVDPESGFRYVASKQHQECRQFETSAGIAAMQDFVRRNHDHCKHLSAQESCHKRYHYTDVSINQVHYDSREKGARVDDIVNATTAALQKLQSQPVSAPFNIKDQREALLLLCHYIGDLQQPLHVGAIYLTPKGEPIEPRSANRRRVLSTRGGNQLLVALPEGNLHRLWDDLAPEVSARRNKSQLLQLARQVRPMSGRFVFWPGRWADDTLVAARKAFAGLSFETMQDEHWKVHLPDDYPKRRAELQKMQLAKAGARLAALLQALWP